MNRRGRADTAEVFKHAEAEGASQPRFAYAARTSQEASGDHPAAASFKNSVRSRPRAIIDILHGGEMAQLAVRAASNFCCRRVIVLEQDAEPLHMVEHCFQGWPSGRAGSWPCLRPSRRSIVGCSNVVLLNGSSGNRGYWRCRSASCPRCASPSWSRADARGWSSTLVIERADLDCAVGDRLRSDDINAAIEAHRMPRQVRKPCRMWPPRSARR